VNKQLPQPNKVYLLKVLFFKSILREKRIKAIDISDIIYHSKVLIVKGENSKYLLIMIAVRRDKDDQIKYVQAIYLDQNTVKKANIGVEKSIYASPIEAEIWL
jgi:hypothetical protein